MNDPVPSPPANAATRWIEAFARELGVEPPARALVESLLDVARVAAHASHRTAAPIACYLVGLSGASPDQAATAATAATTTLHP